MKILFLTKRIYTNKDLLVDRYGRLYGLSAELAHLGHQVTGFCFSYYRDVLKPVQKDHVVDWHSFIVDRTVITSLVKYLAAIQEYIKCHKPDIIIGASDSLHVILAAWLGKRYKLPYLVDLYDNYESFMLTRIPLIKQGLRRSVKNADAVSVVSCELAEYVQQTCVPAGKIAVVENAIPAGKFFVMDKDNSRNQLGLPRNGVLIGTAGALDSSRGTDTLYQSFLSLAKENNNIHLVLAGRTDKKLPILKHERVHYLGELDYDRVPILFNSLDIGIICLKAHAQYSYGFPQKFYEMLACKTPVIAANVGVMKRLFQKYPDNLYAEDDVASLARAITLQMTKPVVPDLPIPTWAEQGKKLDALMNQIVN